MNFPYYIAKRYLFSKKGTNAINVISAVSMGGIAVATMALIVVLSVFNGFHDLVASFFTTFDPQLQIVPTMGKDAPTDDPILTQIKQLPEIDVATECVEDQALAIYQDKQAMVRIKGVEDNFDQLTHITEILYGDGEYELHAGNLQYGILGIRLAQTLGTGAYFKGFLRIYAPMREGQLDLTDPSSGVPIAFARTLFGQQGMLTSLELRLKDGCNFSAVKKEIKKIAGDKYKVLDRYEQQVDTFKIMKIEKLIAYIFLTFILMIACFNIIGSLSMLIIDKKDDVVTLRNLGASEKQITKIFLFEGRMIGAIGAIVGIVMGLVLCWMQQAFGLVKLGESSGSFVVNAYPVSVHYTDVILTFFTVLAVGWIAVWYPVRYLRSGEVRGEK